MYALTSSSRGNEAIWDYVAKPMAAARALRAEVERSIAGNGIRRRLLARSNQPLMAASTALGSIQVHSRRNARLTRAALREMLIEVHRIMQEPDKFEHSDLVDSIEHDVSGISAGLLDVVAEHSGSGASNLAAARVRADGPQGFANQVTVCSSLIFAPPISRVLEDIDDVALRPWRAEYTCHRRALRIEIEFVRDFGH